MKKKTQLPTLQQSKHNNKHDVAIILDAKHGYHEDEDEGSLTTHHNELRHHVGEQDLSGGHSSHPGPVEQTFHTFHDEGWRCEGDG